MRIFEKKDGGIIQLIDKEKMNDWPIELPLLFIEYIRSKQLDSYGDIKKQIEAYLDEIMEDVAIPRLISVLEGENEEEIILMLIFLASKKRAIKALKMLQRCYIQLEIQLTLSQLLKEVVWEG